MLAPPHAKKRGDWSQRQGLLGHWTLICTHPIPLIVTHEHPPSTFCMTSLERFDIKSISLTTKGGNSAQQARDTTTDKGHNHRQGTQQQTRDTTTDKGYNHRQGTQQQTGDTTTDRGHNHRQGTQQQTRDTTTDKGHNLSLIHI